MHLPSIVLSSFLAFLLVSVPAAFAGVCDGPEGSYTVQFSAGDGSSGNPYIVCNVSQLALIDSNLSSYISLGQSIDISSLSDSIGGTFTGTFNGQNYTLSN